MGRRIRLGFLALTVAVATTGAAWGDTVLLTDGTKLEGSISRQGDRMVVKQADGTVVSIEPGTLQKVTLSTTQTPAEVAASDWTRVQSQTKRLDDLSAIIALHEKYLKDHPDAAEAPTAKDALAQYQKMAADGYVKFHGKWMPQAQAEVTLRQADDRARPALDLYRGGQLKEAVEMAKEALKIDDENPTALITAGLASYRLSQLPAARDYFTRLTDAANTNVLGWNNLAVISFQQKREAEALLQYAKALQAAPDNRLLLDNIAAAFHEFKGDKGDRAVPAYKDLARQFEQSETRMAGKMGQKGLYRYGATWVTREQQDNLAANVIAIQKQMKQLDGQYQQAYTTMTALDTAIKVASDTADADLSSYNYWTACILDAQSRNGGLDFYWYTQRDMALADLDRAVKRKAALEEQRASLVSTVKQMKELAPKLTLALATAQADLYAGVQRIMEPGDDITPPPPTPVQMPAKLALPPLPAFVIPQLPQDPPPAPNLTPWLPNAPIVFLPPAIPLNPAPQPGPWSHREHRPTPIPATQPTPDPPTTQPTLKSPPAKEVIPPPTTRRRPAGLPGSNLGE